MEIFSFRGGYNELTVRSNARGAMIRSTLSECVLPWEEVRGLVRALGQAWLENERSAGRMPIKVDRG